MGDVVDLLDRPLYTFRQVDEILGLSSGTARRWIDGYGRMSVQYPPVIRLERTGEDTVTWGEFVEARLITSYRRKDLSLPKLRAYMQALRDRFGNRYPLAHAEPYLTANGRMLVFQIQRDLGLDQNLVLFEEVGTGQTGFAPTPAAENFLGSVEWDRHRGVVASVKPNREFDQVVVDPNLRFGHPQVNGIPTYAVAELYRGGDDPHQIAEWYDLNQEQLRQALEFEGALQAS